MATLARGVTLAVTETVTNTKLHNLVDLGSISGIVNADCDAGMALANSKLANIVDAGKVGGTSLYGLASIPSGAGTLPSEQLLGAFPVGSIYINVTGTNPGTFLGGTWVAFGAGRTLVGLDSTDTDFDTAEETGGAKTVNSSHTHTTPYTGFGVNYPSSPNDGTLVTRADNSGVATTSPNTSSGGSSTLSIVQPYITVYFFKRTA